MGRDIRIASSKVRYATRALVYLATHGAGRTVATREIAATEGIPEKYLEVILGELRAGGILESVKGKYGGFRLAREASQIRLLDIIEVLESAAEATAEPEAAIWQEINRETTELIRRFSIADALLAEERRRGVVNYTI
ncbi:MAG: RrF2 family transcriptional regulator [Alkalispirochaetaceae bacterium]